MVKKYSSYLNISVTEANNQSVINDSASSFTSSSSSVNITQAVGNNITQSGTVTATHAADTAAKRIIMLSELAAGSQGVVNTTLDFDPIDATTFIQEDSVSGTTFSGGQIYLKSSNTYTTLSPQYSGAGVILSNGNLTAYVPVYQKVSAYGALTSGKYYWEVRQDTTGNGQIGITPNPQITNHYVADGTDGGWSYVYAGGFRHAGTYTGSLYTPYGEGDIIGIALDLDNGKIWWSNNGTWVAGDPSAGTGEIYSGIVGPVYPAIGHGTTLTCRFSPESLTYSPPIGFTAGVPATLYPIDPYYITTSDQNQINLTNITEINSCSVTYSLPTYTDIKVLASFDDRTTWKSPTTSGGLTPSVLSASYADTSYVLTNGNKTGEISWAAANGGSACPAETLTSGKWYWEILCESTLNCTAGIYNATNSNFSQYPGAVTNSVGYVQNGTRYMTGSSSWGGTYTTGDVIAFAVDIEAGDLTFYVNNVQKATLTGLSWIQAGIRAAIGGMGAASTNSKMTIRFDPSEQTYSAPSGYTAGYGIDNTSYSWEDHSEPTTVSGWGNLTALSSLLNSYTVSGTDTYLDFAFQLSTTNREATPNIDLITLNYDEVGSYRVNSTDYQVDFISSTQTRVTKLSEGSKNIKLSVLI